VRTPFTGAANWDNVQRVAQLPEESMAATETLLVVENEAAIKALVQMALERHGYVVLTAESGREALSLAAAHNGPIDLLITDVVMPDLRGPELARRLVQQRPGLVTLFMSGYMDDALGDDPTALAVPVDFIQKPFSPSALAARVREMLDRRRGSRAERT
jgi:DNA-binding response OmpR family regulator